jgi:hypothetical protein
MFSVETATLNNLRIIHNAVDSAHHNEESPLPQPQVPLISLRKLLTEDKIWKVGSDERNLQREPNIFKATSQKAH